MTTSHYDDGNGKHSSLSDASSAQAPGGGHHHDRTSQVGKQGSAVTAPVHTTQPLRGGLRTPVWATGGHSLPLYSGLPSSRLGPQQELNTGSPSRHAAWKRSQSPTWALEGLASSWASPQPPLTANIKISGSKMAFKRRKKVILRLA